MNNNLEIDGKLRKRESARKAACHDHTIEFAEHTTAHGLGRAATAKTKTRMYIWVLIFFLCFGGFCIQAYQIMLKYRRKEKMVNVELKFEIISFPAVTICNLNPFKNSLARQVKAVSETLDAFDEQMVTAAEDKTAARKRRATPRTSNSLFGSVDETNVLENQRSLRSIEARCRCVPNGRCVFDSALNADSCVCLIHRELTDIRVCYRRLEWITYRSCRRCPSQPDSLCPHSVSEATAVPGAIQCDCHLRSGRCVWKAGADWLAVRQSTTATAQFSPDMSVRLIDASCRCDRRRCDAHIALDVDDRHCLCASYGTALGPCALSHQWQRTHCGDCSATGHCAYPTTIEDADGDSNGDRQSCFCHAPTYTCIAERAQQPASIRALAPLPRRDRRATMEKFMEDISDMAGSLKPAYTACHCLNGDDKQCDAEEKIRKPNANDTVCLCFYNSAAEKPTIWPCYRPALWQSRKCHRCATIGSCDLVSAEERDSGSIPCLCVDELGICVKSLLIDKPLGGTPFDGEVESGSGETPGGDSDENFGNDTSALDLNDYYDARGIVKIWDELSTTASTINKTVELKESLGFEGLKDTVAIRAKAKENLVFAVAEMSSERKTEMSYQKDEFIRKCSYNREDCSIEDDFDLLLDPTFGNCYTFNGNGTNNYTSERSGPTYGLRLQLLVNISDYLPTTESAGVRIAIHPQTEQPFPDTLGYNAPTGFVSLYGIRLKKITRLPAPYGTCVEDYRPSDFIYQDKVYTTEACYRSCMQNQMATMCGCGHPHYPPPINGTNCPLTQSRACLERESKKAAKMKGELGCHCPQPCSEHAFSVTYSASTWPATVDQVADDCPDYLDDKRCLHYFREEAAMVEIFFEKLNYESLIETEAYGMANLIADFGGNLGLFIGVSVITMIEVVVFLFDLLRIVICGGGRRQMTRHPTPDTPTEMQPTMMLIENGGVTFRRKSKSPPSDRYLNLPFIEHGDSMVSLARP